MAIAGLLQNHHQLWPQVGEAALFLADLLQAVIPELGQASSELSAEVKKLWTEHPDDLGVSPHHRCPYEVSCHEGWLEEQDKILPRALGHDDKHDVWKPCMECCFLPQEWRSLLIQMNI